jgi:hypothetical protein
MLIYTVSLELQLPTHITIHNQCLNTKLVSPFYFSNGVVCPKLSDQQVDIDTAMRTCFEINVTQDVFEGALIFKLQRRSDNKYNVDTSPTETSEATCIQMFVAWKVKNSVLFAYIALVEHVKELTWNEDKLKKLYDKSSHLLKESDGTISDAWIMNDNTMLKTTFSIKGLKENFGLNISISEEERDRLAIRPLYIDLRR